MKQKHNALPPNFDQGHNLTGEPYGNDEEAYTLIRGSCWQAYNWRSPSATYHGTRDLNATIPQLLWNEAAQVRCASTSEGYNIVPIRTSLQIRGLQPFLICVSLETSTRSVDCHTEDIKSPGSIPGFLISLADAFTIVNRLLPTCPAPATSQCPYGWGLKKSKSKQPLKFTLKPKSP